MGLVRSPYDRSSGGVTSVNGDAGPEVVLDSVTPAAHQSTHRIGGADALPAASTSTPGLVQLASSGETTAGEAVQASDTRLSDPRQPSTGTTPERGQALVYTGTAWDSGGWSWHTSGHGWRAPASGSTPSAYNGTVTYSNIGSSATVVQMDGLPAIQQTSAAGDPGYQPSAYTAIRGTADYTVFAQSVCITSSLAGMTYYRVGVGAAAMTGLGVAGSDASPARVALLVKPDGTVYLETADGSTNTLTQLSGLTYAAGDVILCELAWTTAKALARVRKAGAATVYTASTTSSIPGGSVDLAPTASLRRASGTATVQHSEMVVRRVR